MRSALRWFGGLLFVLGTPFLALLLTRHVATTYAVVAFKMQPGSTGFYFPDSFGEGYYLGPTWASWEAIGWSLVFGVLGSILWMRAWRRLPDEPLAPVSWLTSKSIFAAIALACLAGSLHLQLSDIPRTDTFIRVR